MPDAHSIPGDYWLESVVKEVLATTTLSETEARRRVYEAEEQAVADGRVIEVGGHRWAVRPSTLRLAESEGDELLAARLRRALARLQREGKRFG